MELNLHAISECSLSNGPGKRFVIWFQGCTLNCPGCFNPTAHSSDKNILIKSADLISLILQNSDSLEGISISGGEPFQQAQGLFKFLSELKIKTNLSVLIFSGYILDEINNIKQGKEILNLTDILVAGRYKENMKSFDNLLGSSNQVIHFLSDHYSSKDLSNIPEAEIIIDKKGNIVFTGINPLPDLTNASNLNVK